MDKTALIVDSIPLFKEKLDPICSKYQVGHQELIKELVRFLDLIHISKSKLSPSLIVDLAWHELILFTRFYTKFCTEHYGRYIHHTPSKNTKPGIFNKTIQFYIQQFGQPNPLIWGKQAKEEWELSNCGSCLN
ncbi:glycine-rich domain-containing protein [Aquimarina brevivitae]|uniref:Uncharacterized protein n=1 Tax=Aquimarina brevivitae TaxID=323412 RepID=A0A4Q7PGA1_9FLAO|nr:hypothetical protein [Aquimarina brevivitae]RZS98908.1 hypothetical protein EV197_0109 [Aquimarina brevivitae]